MQVEIRPMEEGEPEIQVLEQEGQQQEQPEGARDMVGGGATGERLVGTVAIVETPSSIPEVQGALVHAHRVALGLSPLLRPFSSAPSLPCPIHPQLLLQGPPRHSPECQGGLCRGQPDLQVSPLVSNLPGAPAGPKGLPRAPGRELDLKLLLRPQLQLLPQEGAGSPQYCHKGMSLALSQLESLLIAGSSLSSPRRVATGGTRGSTPFTLGTPPRRSSGRLTT